ncbi:MAG TPA: ion transporter [Cyclobacteriaceae bacterium]|nr:ion transporter [Cyclobacteriaceae bacterium]
MKIKTFQFVEKGAHGRRINLAFDYAIMVLITLNVIAIILDTIPPISDSYAALFHYFELVSVIIFSLEYLMRLYVSDLTHPSSGRIKSALKFVFSPYGIIDLVSILPFYLPFLIKMDLRFLRMIRLMRFFRVLKLTRYNNSLNLIWEVIKEKRDELAMTGFVTLLFLLIASILIYFIEGAAQPESYPNLLTCFWWAIATLTSVGFEDIYPITGFGKFLSSLLAIFGIGLIAIPTGLISAGFMEKISKKNEGTKNAPIAERKSGDIPRINFYPI